MISGFLKQLKATYTGAKSYKAILPDLTPISHAIFYSDPNGAYLSLTTGDKLDCDQTTGLCPGAGFYVYF
jgi:hypothetical protein